jgi:hypothetical protein
MDEIITFHSQRATLQRPCLFKDYLQAGQKKSPLCHGAITTPLTVLKNNGAITDGDSNFPDNFAIQILWNAAGTGVADMWTRGVMY